MNISEDPEYIIPVELHNTTLRKVSEFLSKHSELELEIHSEYKSWRNFILTGLKSKFAIRCEQFTIQENKEHLDGWSALPLKLQIEYICLAKKTLLYLRK